MRRNRRGEVENMQIKSETIKDAFAVKITAEEDGKIIGRAYLYILKNELHPEPFGFLEDVFVEEKNRSRGVGSDLIKKAIEEAKTHGCYKLICTSRTSNEKAHKFYEKFGFKKWGAEFRIDLS